ncbi:DivIVA domain-containing protein [Aerococcaceae bacterium zg-B36]|uniref:DivIVA domain-containing protein n=1 Tax=Aerococcaceae bacterium zg-252 TaxID=2796928 RepID=UPI001BD8B67A|nr:DivIVA domain-containing protein [Aerococcaceae bacterium zg-B36]
MGSAEQLRKTFFFGYSRASVEEKIQQMYREQKMLKDTVKNQEETINDLKERLARFESKELLISEVIVEAKDLAKNVIKDAHAEASDIRSSTEEVVTNRLSNFELSMAELEAIKREIVLQESYLKGELKSVLQKHMDFLETIDLSAFVEINDELDRSMNLAKTVKEEIQQTETEKQENNNRKIIDLIPKSKVVEVEVDEIPTYNFEQLRF